MVFYFGVFGSPWLIEAAGRLGVGSGGGRDCSGSGENSLEVAGALWWQQCTFLILKPSFRIAGSFDSFFLDV